MSSDDQDQILAKISRLAGQINRHKNQQAGLATPPNGSYGARGNTWQRGGAPQRGGGFRARGYRVAKPPHRNRSLVLNGSAQSSTPDGQDSPSGSSTPTSWVTKNDRHRQLINANIYEKDAQARTKAIEQTRIQKRQQYNEEERSKLFSYFSHKAGGGGSGVTNGNAARYEVVVEGIRFYVTKNGSKLVKVPDDLNPANLTPKTALVGGVKFYRSKNGNLYREGIVAARRHSSAAVKKTNQPCKVFTTTGSCALGPRCRYIHDAFKVAACKDFLQKGHCSAGELCDLSHDLTPERTPHCLHFIKGNCTNPNCRYAHVQISPGALVCRPFGIYGFCERGANCSDRHAYECPEFSNTGSCKNKKCKLPHRERGSMLRKANAERGAADAESNLVDQSSDDEDESAANSDDVDSDEVEEFVEEEEGPDLDFATQKDFIGF